MTIRRKMALPAAAALMLFGLMVVAQSASATHVRPKAATPFYASLVPAYNACTSPNRTHAAPLSYGSCNPPVQTSPNVTVGTPDANGAAANMSGFVKLVVKPTSPEDVLITSSLSDVRCKPGSGISGAVCTGANTDSAGSDYSGQLQGNATIRITDHFNTVTTAPIPACSSTTSCSATVVDLPFPVTGTCAATPADGTIGGTCSITTTADAVVPTAGGVVKEGKKATVEVGQILVNDGGTDGLASTAGNTVYARQGIYIP